MKEDRIGYNQPPVEKVKLPEPPPLPPGKDDNLVKAYEELYSKSCEFYKAMESEDENFEVREWVESLFKVTLEKLKRRIG